MQPYAPPPDPRPRRPWLASLVALSVLLVLLVAAIVVVAVDKYGGRSVAGPPPSGGPPGIDPCVVGNWRVTSHEETVDIEDYGPVTFHGEGTRLRLDEDGRGITDYGSGTRFTGLVNGSTIELTLIGTVEFRYQAANGQVSFADVTPKGTAMVRVNGSEPSPTPLRATHDPAMYTCHADELTEQTAVYLVEMVRDS